MKHKIYLAGKITRHGWRDAIVNQCHVEDDATYEDFRLHQGDDGRGIIYGQFASMETVPGSWKVRVSEHYDITGPFFIDGHWGSSHDSSTHANSPEYFDPREPRDQVRRLCLDAIRRSDVVFAWLDDPTAYGTIAELGYAHALGKRIVLAVPPCPTPDVYEHSFAGHGSLITCDCMIHGDTWFVAGMVASRLDIFKTVDAITAWDWWIENEITFDNYERRRRELREGQNEVELMFWDAHENYRGTQWIHDLEPQYKISAGGKNYRLDFYSPSRKFAIEVDGLRWHNGDSWIKDRNRQRDLENAGIRFHRYAAKEVMNDAQDCYRQAAERANNL